MTILRFNTYTMQLLLLAAPQQERARNFIDEYKRKEGTPGSPQNRGNWRALILRRGNTRR
jgi:hypothetical protein